MTKVDFFTVGVGDHTDPQEMLSDLPRAKADPYKLPLADVVIGHYRIKRKKNV